MAGQGRKYVFHGQFKEKSEAERKEARTAGSFVLNCGKNRFCVVTPKRKRK